MERITCPWCGTNYTSFQPNCDNCGGTLPLPGPAEATAPHLRVPPPAPRQVPRNYVGRLLLVDGAAIVGGIFLLLGLIFGLVGLVLTITIVAAFVGLPFLGLGIVFSLVAVPLLVWRAQAAQRTAEVLRAGEPVLGQIVSVQQNYHVRVNGRYPWSIVYRFAVMGREYEGKASTLSQPDLSQQAGQPVYVLYARGNPEQSTIYPHPYGYYGV